MKNKILVLLITGIILGLSPITVLADIPPELRDGSAQPPIVVSGETVVYHVIYTDADGDPPEYVKVYFTNTISQEMKKISGDYTTGAIYEYRWEKQDDGYDYRFEASDGKTVVKFPWYGGTLAPVNILSEKLDNNKIYFFNKQSNKSVWSYSTGTNWVSDIAISDNGDYITAQAGSSIYLFSKESSTPLWTYDCGYSSDRPAGGFLVDISANGEYIIGACQNSIHLFSKNSNQPIWSYGENIAIYTVSISADGKYLALGTSNSDELVFFSRENNKPLWKYQATSDIHGLSLSSDGKLIAAGSHSPEEMAYLFSKDSNVPLRAYKTSQDSPVWTAAMSRDGKYSVYGLDSSDTYNSIFGFSNSKDTPLKTWKTGWWVRSVDISSDGKYIAAGSGDHNVYLFDGDKDEPLWKSETGERVGSVSISADGNYIAAGSRDKNTYFFSKESNTPLWKHKADSWINTVSISADGNFIASGTGASQYLSEGHNSIYNPEKRTTPPSENISTDIKNKSVCGDTICERDSGETDENCPKDCNPGAVATDIENIESGTAVCGDTICDRDKGETSETCQQDCAPQNYGKIVNKTEDKINLGKEEKGIDLLPIIGVIIFVIIVICVGVILKNKL